MISIRRKLKRRTAIVVDHRNLLVQLYPDHIELWRERKRNRVRLDYATLYTQAVRKQERLFE